MTLTIPQGATCAISASNVRLAGDVLDMTGWTVHGVIRQYGVTGPVVAEWSTSPSGSQGEATAGNGEAELVITPDMSSAWTWSRGWAQAKATEPGENGRTVRIINQEIDLDPDAVPE